MKKILCLATLLVAIAACSTEPPATAPTTNANNATATKPTAAISEADATTREKATWDALKKKDFDAFGNMTSTDYIEVGSDGVFDKAGIIAYVKDISLTDATFTDWKLLPIDKDAYLIIYQTKLNGTYKGTPIPVGPYRSSAAWVNRDGKWQVIFYQETIVPTDGAAGGPPATPSPSAKATTSPAAKSAASPPATTAAFTPGADAVANEQAVWAALKAKQLDQFANFLAPEMIEVEPEGVFAKAESVQSVSQVDFKNSTLSEFKTTKLDGDATLVSYLVNMPMPGGKQSKQRHSTIWVNRDGKWLAIFHQGSPLEPTPPAGTTTGPKASPSTVPKASPSTAPKTAPTPK